MSLPRYNYMVVKNAVHFKFYDKNREFMISRSLKTAKYSLEEIISHPTYKRIDIISDISNSIEFLKIMKNKLKDEFDDDDISIFIGFLFRII